MADSGQLVRVELEETEEGEPQEHELTFKSDGTVQIEAPSVILKVTGEDSSGNTATVQVNPQFVH